MPFDLSLLTQFISVLLGGGALGVILTYRVKLRQLDVQQHSGDREADRVDFDAILAEMKAQRDAAWAQSEKRDRRIDQLEAEIQGLRLARDLDPFPHWVSDNAGEYLYVNREFERHFLEPLGQTYRDAVGKRREDIWSAEFSKTLRLLDAAARARPDGTARATTTVDVPEAGICRVTAHKFPIRFKPSGVIVAYAGYITEITPETEALGAPA